MDWVLALLGLPVLFGAGYLFALVLLSWRPAPPAYGPPRLIFRILVPAHNESAGIATTVQSLFTLDYPRDLYDVVVIADNCTDDTVERAREAGAEVLERTDDKQRGKGYALNYAFERLPESVDAAVVIDADTLVSPNLLRAFGARLEGGAHAVQADYAVRNPTAAWRTRLMAIAFGAFHIVRSRGREQLRVSAGLRGNGMCFSTVVLRRVPHDAYSIVEDVEYGIRLAEAGYRVVYADEAHVYGEMVTTSKAARSQRERWEGGRAALARRHALGLLRKGVVGNRVLLDLGVDLLVPPLSRIAMAAALGLLSSYVLVGAGPSVSMAVFVVSLTALVVYVLRGWTVSGTGIRGLFDLALAPAYVIWKLTLARKQPSSSPAWVRTTREPTEPASRPADH